MGLAAKDLASPPHVARLDRLALGGGEARQGAAREAEEGLGDPVAAEGRFAHAGLLQFIVNNNPETMNLGRGAFRGLVATQSLMTELGQRGFLNLGMWTRGVDTDLFRPERAIELGFARPIFLTMGPLAAEKNLETFLALDLPGTKVFIRTGPQTLALERRTP